MLHLLFVGCQEVLKSVSCRRCDACLGQFEELACLSEFCEGHRGYWFGESGLRKRGSGFHDEEGPRRGGDDDEGRGTGASATKRSNKNISKRVNSLRPAVRKKARPRDAHMGLSNCTTTRITHSWKTRIIGEKSHNRVADKTTTCAEVTSQNMIHRFNQRLPRIQLKSQ